MEATATMNALEVYAKSDGALTRQFYSELEKRGPLGVVALNLFRAQKCSTRAKLYRRKYKDLAYDRKGWSLKQLCECLQQHGAQFGITFGWGRDEDQPLNKWVLYVDLPEGQVSFHSPERYNGPDYPGQWDGQRMSEQRIIAFCGSVYERGH